MEREKRRRDTDERFKWCGNKPNRVLRAQMMASNRNHVRVIKKQKWKKKKKLQQHVRIGAKRRTYKCILEEYVNRGRTSPDFTNSYRFDYNIELSCYWTRCLLCPLGNSCQKGHICCDFCRRDYKHSSSSDVCQLFARSPILIAFLWAMCSSRFWAIYSRPTAFEPLIATWMYWSLFLEMELSCVRYCGYITD